MKHSENFAVVSLRTLGVCAAASNNEHPIVRAAGATLAVAPRTTPAFGLALLTFTAGWLVAKNKKEAFLSRACGICSTLISTGIVAKYIDEPEQAPEETKED